MELEDEDKEVNKDQQRVMKVICLSCLNKKFEEPM